MKTWLAAILAMSISAFVWADGESIGRTQASAASNDAVKEAGKPTVSGTEVVQGLQSLTPAQLDRVLADYDKFDDNTKRQFKDVLAKPNPFMISLLTSAANRIAPESRQQLADSIARVKAGK